MSEIDRLTTFVYDWMKSNGLVEIPSKTPNSNRVRLDAWKHSRSNRPLGLERQTATVNFWLRQSDVPRSIPDGVKSTLKVWDGTEWFAPVPSESGKRGGANSNLKTFAEFEGHDLVRLGVRTIDQARSILEAVFGPSASAAAATNIFLLKVNGELHCPDGICRPASADDWEGGDVLIHNETPRSIVGGKLQDGAEIIEGDHLWIWTHEDEAYGSGQGLMATAEAGGIGIQGSERTVTLRKVRLLPQPAGFKDGFAEPTSSAVIEFARSHRHRRVIEMTSQDVAEIEALLGIWSKDQSARKAAATAHLSDWNELIKQHKDDLLTELAERQLSSRKPRPNQQAFRTALVDAYRGRCVITGLGITEALEAAHILPHTGDARFDVVENGLLLRRDLHTLFDAFLWSINPHTSKVVLAKPLLNSPYLELNGKTAEHQAAPEALKFHVRQFKQRQEDSGSMDRERA
ncbi:MAG: HNH endonuclease signature motif containing protein [Henriciella sp.]|uniref:HNH endonuclease n=1 Tax=Henriciella sp. TaxID=1968823 RepID=UPI003C751569